GNSAGACHEGDNDSDLLKHVFLQWGGGLMTKLRRFYILPMLCQALI
ncbi:MAG: hypothetical protein RLZZ513_1930, partial [Pseudomonadota bacterium]